MSKESVKIVIGGRSYPLNVKESEKERVMKAADTINSSIKKLQESYAVKDMQDLLAMTALQLASNSKNKMENNSSSVTADCSKIEQALEELSKEFDS